MALFRIAQDVVGFLHVLEAVFGGLIARIQIRMIFAREFPVGFADLVFRGAAGDAERLIVIVFWRACHFEVREKTRAGI
jgi:hypothetical protein